MKSPNKGNLYFFLSTISLFIGGIVVTLSIKDPTYMTTYLEFGFLFFPAIVLLLLKGNIKENLMLNSIKFKDLFIVIAVGVLSILVTFCINIISYGLFKNFVSDAVNPLSTMPLIKILFLVAITPSICEELLFRGLILSEYRNISIHKAAIMNGLLFGLFHQNINQFLYTFFLGVVMVYVVSITKSIFSSVLMHFMLNGFSAFNLWRSSSSAIAEPVTTEVTQSIPLNVKFFALIFMLILIRVIVLILKKWAESKGLSLSQPVNIEEELLDEDYRSEFENSEENKVFDVWVIISIVFFVLNILLMYGLSGLI